MAIDDVEIAEGPCDPAGYCDFDSDRCGWVNADGDQFDWLRTRGSTPSGGTGPTNDHTTGTPYGMSILFPPSLKFFFCQGGARGCIQCLFLKPLAAHFLYPHLKKTRHGFATTSNPQLGRMRVNTSPGMFKFSPRYKTAPHLRT